MKTSWRRNGGEHFACPITQESDSKDLVGSRQETVRVHIQGKTDCLLTDVTS